MSAARLAWCAEEGRVGGKERSGCGVRGQRKGRMRRACPRESNVVRCRRWRGGGKGPTEGLDGETTEESGGDAVLTLPQRYALLTISGLSCGIQY